MHFQGCFTEGGQHGRLNLEIVVAQRELGEATCQSRQLGREYRQRVAVGPERLESSQLAYHGEVSQPVVAHVEMLKLGLCE